jgi:hypothetical protein
MILKLAARDTSTSTITMPNVIRTLPNALIWGTG